MAAAAASASEEPACLGDLAELVVEGLDGIGRVDHAAYLAVEGEEGDELLPGALPTGDQAGVVLAVVGSQLVECRERLGLGGGGVDRSFEILKAPERCGFRFSSRQMRAM